MQCGTFVGWIAVAVYVNVEYKKVTENSVILSQI